MTIELAARTVTAPLSDWFAHVATVVVVAFVRTVVVVDRCVVPRSDAVDGTGVVDRAVDPGTDKEGMVSTTVVDSSTEFVSEGPATPPQEARRIEPTTRALREAPGIDMMAL